jgi:hypothetical protein
LGHEALRAAAKKKSQPHFHTHSSTRHRSFSTLPFTLISRLKRRPSVTLPRLTLRLRPPRTPPLRYIYTKRRRNILSPRKSSHLVELAQVASGFPGLSARHITPATSISNDVNFHLEIDCLSPIKVRSDFSSLGLSTHHSIPSVCSHHRGVRGVAFSVCLFSESRPGMIFSSFVRHAPSPGRVVRRGTVRYMAGTSRIPHLSKPPLSPTPWSIQAAVVPS